MEWEKKFSAADQRPTGAIIFPFAPQRLRGYCRDRAAASLKHVATAASITGVTYFRLPLISGGLIEALRPTTRSCCERRAFPPLISGGLIEA